MDNLFPVRPKPVRRQATVAAVRSISPLMRRITLQGADVAAFLDAHPETELVALSRLLYHDEQQKFSRHPLHRHFAR